MKTLATFALLLLVTACQAPPADMTEAEIAQIEAEVLTIGDQWIEAVNAVDPERFLTLFDRAGTHATDGYHYANYEEWADHIGRLFSSWESVNWAWASTRVDMIAPDAAMFVGHAEGTRDRVDGTSSDDRPGVTLLVKKSGGVWKIAYQGTAFRPS